MDIFGQLGINTTAAFQFVIFAIALTFLSKFVFAPYFHALEERQKRTKGGEDLALEFQTKAVALQSKYEEKTRELNLQIKAILDAAKSQANKEYETIVSSAREESGSLVQINRKSISTAVQQATADLKSQTSSIALAITSKLLK